MSANSVGRFDGRSSDYARYRPSYPSGAIDVLLAGLGEPRDVRAVDAGAGTGISTALLAERGVRAIGLEPNEGMRAQATRLGLDVRPGTVTDNDLPHGEADLVTAFQAFHWFADERSTRALGALLRPNGRIGLVWNLFDRSDAFTDAYCDLIDRFADPYNVAGLGYERVAETTANLPSADPPVTSEDGVDGSVIGRVLRLAGFVQLRIREVPYVQSLNEDALLGRLRSSSSAPTSGPDYDAMAAALHDLAARSSASASAGDFPLAHRTHVILAERPVPANRG